MNQDAKHILDAALRDALPGAAVGQALDQIVFQPGGRLILVAAGALGNAIDRVAHGFVVDMFDFRLIHFPVFNVADIFICAGGVLFVLYFMFQHKETSEAEK